MNQPSKAAPILMILFGLVFMGFGLFGASAFFFGKPGTVHGSPTAAILVCSVFTVIGLAITLATVFGNRALTHQFAAQQTNPDSPWLWRKDWAASRAESKNRNSVFALAFFTVVWNAIAITIATASVPKLLHDTPKMAFLPLGFCLIGVILMGATVRSFIRRERFGQTYFEFASLPFSPGKPLRGGIHLRFNTSTRHGVDLTLSCVRQVITGSGNNRSTQDVILWSDQRNVSEQSLTPGPMGDAVIPVDFTIPSDAYETNHDQPSDQVLWLLHAQADVPGVNFSDDFEVPVFRLNPAEAPVVSSDSSGFIDSTAAPAFQSDSSDVSAPENPKVVVSTGANGGTEFYFPPFRNPARVLILLGFTAGWTMIIYFLRGSKAPVLFPIVFGLFDLILIYGVLQMAFGSYRIEVGDGKVALRRKILGLGEVREIPFVDVDQIFAVSAAMQGTNPKNSSYSIRLKTKSGSTIVLADAIDDRQEARWVTAQLEKFVGLKLDTHVAVDFGLASGPPPQRGQFPSAPGGIRKGGPVAAVVGIAFFMMWAGFVGYQFFNLRRAVPQRPRTARSAVAGQSQVQRVTYSRLTPKDEARLQTLPEQTQAEELLERALQHDTRARELFEQNIAIWQGDIKLTDHMKQLEWRTRFSTDLRVRYINADLNLAMDGWPKTEESIDLLIARAQSDHKYRPAAVYFMGMLAGRGVGYNTIYPVLLDYAQHDPDASVRQWAVEGMRYLGTDEALDQLFYSFTHDPSDAVRNRAGCNVSDCGNFMRKQRMRMVPQLIDLAADPQTNAQMRNWAFLALREITDENVPNDAPAWQDWYRDHGLDKAAQFEQMDWWKVRGDE